MADMVFLTKLKPEPMGTYNASAAYGINSLVMSADGAAAYLSVKDVPAGTPLTDTSYWKIHTDLSLVKQNAEEAAAKALAARNEMIEIARNLTDAVSAEGNPVRAELVGGLPFDKVVTKLEPVQAGSGDPYPAGGGPNLLPYVAETTMNGATIKTAEDGGVYISGTPTSNTLFSFACNIALDGSYVFSMGNAEAIGDHLQMRLLDASGSMGNTNFNAASADAYTIVAASKTITQFVIRLGSGIAYDVTIYPQLIAGTEKQEFHPYENIRTISGWTGAEMVYAGANLFNGIGKGNTVGGVTIEKVDISKYRFTGTAANNAIYQFTNPFTLPAGIYTLSHEVDDASLITSTYGAICQVVSDGKILAHVSDLAKSITFTLDKETEVYGRIHVAAGRTYSGVTISFQLEAGSAASAWQPYAGSTYSADFGQTVYGGELDWQTGVLTVDRAMVTLDGTEQYDHAAEWSDGSYSIPTAIPDAVKVSGYATVAEIVCSHVPTAAPQDIVNGSQGVAIGQANTSLYFNFGTQYNTTDLIKAFIAAQYAADTPVQIAYRLANPTTIQLTAQELAQLEGANTLYGDGTIAITGRQRPDLALVSRIEALESAILNA